MKHYTELFRQSTGRPIPSFCALILILIGLSPILLYGSASADTFKKVGKGFQVGPNPSAMAAADLNEDKLPEIVTANIGSLGDPRQEKPANDELSLLKATPSESGPEYVTETPLRTDGAPYAITIANVDALRALDIVAVSFMAVNHHDVTLFRNLGEMVFEKTVFRIPDEKLTYNRMLNSDREPVFTKPGLTSLTLADLNGDGFRDVVCTAWSSDCLIILPGVAETYFGDPVFIPANGGPRDVHCADLDSDGKLEIISSMYVSGEIAIWKDDGKGEYKPLTRFSSRGRLPSKIQITDINRDGKMDIVVSHCHTDDSVVIFYNDNSFNFSTSQELMLGTDRELLEHEIRDMVVADFSGDGHPDIAVACHTSGQVDVLMNQSTDSSIPQAFAREVYPMEGGKPRALCVADFNKDGLLDVAVASWGSNTVNFLLNLTPAAAPPPKKTVEKESAVKTSGKEKETSKKASGKEKKPH